MRNDLLPVTYEGALCRIIQECAEVIKTITKIQQYGFRATDDKTNITYDNLKDMFSEFNDLEHAIRSIREFHKDKHKYDVPMPDTPDISLMITDPWLERSLEEYLQIYCSRCNEPESGPDT